MGIYKVKDRRGRRRYVAKRTQQVQPATVNRAIAAISQ